MINQNLSLAARLQAPTPKFFRTVRVISLVLGAVGTAILTAPVTLPAAIVTIAGYIATAGAVAAAVSSTTVDYNALERKQALDDIGSGSGWPY